MSATRTIRTSLLLIVVVNSMWMCGQDVRIPHLVQGALLDRGQVFIGRITEPPKFSVGGGKFPSVTVVVDEYLRGVKIVGGKIDLMVDATVDTGLSRPPAWLNVEIKPGRRILVIMRPGAGTNYPARVLDLDSSEGKTLLPAVRRIIAADDQQPQERKLKLTEALNDSSPLVRDFAKYRLRTHPGAVDLERVQKFNATVDAAFVGRVEDRLQAIKELAVNVYDNFNPDGEVSPHVRFVLGELIMDPNPAIRGEAIKALGAKIFAREQSPEHLTNVFRNSVQREKLLAQLEKDLRDQPSYADDAGQLLCAVDRTADSRCTPRGFRREPPRR